jgi:hypothetical protein
VKAAIASPVRVSSYRSTLTAANSWNETRAAGGAAAHTGRNGKVHSSINKSINTGEIAPDYEN